MQDTRGDLFQEPRTEVDVEQVIQKSRFVGRVRRACTEEEARAGIRELSQQYKNATHNCWAYRVGFPSPKEYFSDDGEPAGTAGKPILGAILRQELTNVFVVVTRYYGGIKLGVRGLIEAYGGSASLALGDAGIALKQMAHQACLEVSYEAHQKIVHQLKDLDVSEKLIDQNFGATVTLSFPVPLSKVEEGRLFFDGGVARGTIIEWHWKE